MTKPLLNVLNKKTSNKLPIWLMRQAGRYLPEYMKVRKNFSDFIEFCLTPEAACEVTLQPLKRFDLDAAIIFSDILIVPHAMGVKVTFEKGHGPKLENYKKISELKEVDERVFETIGKSLNLVSNELGKDKTLIGFCGSPWTIAAYVIQGGGSRDFDKARKFAIENEQEFVELINKIVEATCIYLDYQIKNGAEVIKLFDSWAGVLPLEELRKWVIDPNSKIANYLRENHPEIKIIGFPRKVGVNSIEFIKKVDVDCIAVDQFTPIDWAVKNLNQKVIQGNLDNYLLLGEKERVKKEVQNILKTTKSSNFVFNLGHGIMPESKIENIETLIKTIRENASN